MLSGGGLDVDLAARKPKIGGDVVHHRRYVRRHLRRLGDDRGVDVHHAVARLLHQRADLAQQAAAVGAAVARIAAAPSSASHKACSRTSASEWPSSPFSYAMCTPPMISLRPGTRA